jgi:DNA-binding CsgD family transcriptional regulator
MEQAILAPFASFAGHPGAPWHDAGPDTADRLDAGARARYNDPASPMQTILDHVHFGVAVVDTKLGILFVNQAASRECARNPAIRIDAGKFVLPEPRHQQDLTRAIAAARQGRWSLVQVGDGDDRTMLAVMPLWPHSAGTEAPALVMFSLRSASKALAIQFFAQSNGLTPAEARVLRALSDGLSPREIAERHKVGMATVRTQLGSIRNKTDARSVTDLVRTLGCLPPIMPAALSSV